MYNRELNYEPLVSVVVPTYKRSVRYLRRAVESLLHQTYKNTEIIVIDDSPSDYCERCAVRDYMNSVSSDRVSYYQNEKNVGGSLSRNRGIQLARGEYITFLDDDDEYKPEKIRNQVAFMQKTGCDLSFSDMVMYNVNGQIVDYREYKDISSFENSELLKYHLMKHMTGTPTFMFKAEKLRDLGGFDDVKMGQEFHLMLKAIESGLVIRYFPQCDVKVYKHAEGGISQGKNKITGEKGLYEFKKQYFGRLAKSDIAYINFRHWAVMAVAYMRNRQYTGMMISGIKSFLSSPQIFFKQIFLFLHKIRKARSHG